MNTWLWLGMALGLLSFGLALAENAAVRRKEEGSEKARKVAAAIREGAWAYLARLYKALAGLALVLGTILGFALGGGSVTRGFLTALVFVCGSLCSAAAGYLGMSVAVRANVRTAHAASSSLGEAFEVAYRAGSVLALAMVGMAVFGMSLVYLIFRDSGLVLAFSFGASSLALLAKAGGGIYTKTADIAADLVGKVEAGIPEDDPRNPAVIADNVGDNVGDVAGMGADIFDSYVASVVAAMIIGESYFAASPSGEASFYAVLPLILATLGILSSFAGIGIARAGRKGKPGGALNRATVGACLVFALLGVGLFLATGWNPGALLAALAGLAVGVLIGFTTDWFTNPAFRPVRRTAEISRSGAALTIVSGLSWGFLSLLPSVAGIVAATLAAWAAASAHGLPGIYGVAMAAVGMLSLSGVIVANDAYGPIVDNAKGIAEMSGAGEEAVARADELDAAGNTAKAITKGFAIGAAALTVLALFSAYRVEVESFLPGGVKIDLGLENPLVLAGILLGAILPPAFSALTMLAVTRNAFAMIEEIRRQFREIPGILAGSAEPDYVTCVGLASRGALGALVLPGLIAVALPLAVGFLLGPAALGGLLGGAIFTGLVFALFMSNSGGLWDNAKKSIEAGAEGGPGSDAHRAAVVGDTVGDPFKDTAGPSLNTLITVMSLAASLFAPLVAAWHLFG